MLYIMFGIMMLCDWYWIIVIFCNYQRFLQCEIILFQKIRHNPASKYLQSSEMSLYIAFINE